ncbi:ABC transporter substrate-binding protein [Betaproteobacteria bacterium PRO7]|jgi:branched-chain amino acid transport system substrate-binding protein|nr:ABC transporter substrate-binding protein [Betaproteobacteria bacterium PRO7]GIL06909.1 MAG: ABC transporter substrate-binding protein [Betaproteobacteria bacterium]
MQVSRRRRALLGAFAAGSVVASARAGAQGKRAAERPIRIGEVNSYSTIPQFLVPYRLGWQLALDEVNAAGGLLGRSVEVIARDDAGKPDDAIRHATELVTNEKVDLLAGAFLSNVGLALADFALRNKVLFVASEPLTDAIVWEKGNRYTFRLRPSTYMQSAMLVDEAAKLPAKRWVTIAPNYEYGQSAVASFKALLKSRRPDVEFVAEQWPALNKLEAGSTLQAVIAARPEAIFNVTFGADLARLVREGNLRGLFPRVPVVSLLSGEPEYLDVLKDETPKGWIVTGYPWDQIDTPEHAKFFNAYYRKNNDYPRLGSVVGYSAMQAIFAAIRKAKSTDTEKLIAALRGLAFVTPFGPATFRAIDHQSTMGAYVGKLDVRAGKGTMVDWRYADGAKYLPSDDEVRKRRPAEAMK